MHLNTGILDNELLALQKRGELIQQIKRLVEDPEARSIIEKMMLNGSANNSQEVLKGSSPVQSKPNVVATMGSDSDLSLIDTVRRAVSNFDGERFVVGDVADLMRSAGLDVDNIQIGRVLRRLDSVFGEIRIARQGAGASPHVYERTDKLKMI